MKDLLCKVVENRNVRGRLFLLELHAPEIAKSVKAGQFVTIRVSKSLDPMGRRAFAVADIRGENILSSTTS